MKCEVKFYAVYSETLDRLRIMNSFVETSLRNFCSTRDIFGDQSAVYVHFEKKPEGKE